MKKIIDTIQFGFSENVDGNMRLGAAESSENRKRYFGRLGIGLGRVVSAGLAQGDRVVRVGENEAGQIIPDCDGLVTDQPGLTLTITAADCLPVYFWDEEKGAIGLAHAGWRGLAANIPSAMAKAMQNEFGSRPPDIKVRIGPHIRSCHFQVQDDVAAVFVNHQDAIVRRERGKFIDLEKIARAQLAVAGVLAANIKAGADCVFCEREIYFSYRRDRPPAVQAMIAYILKSV